MARDTLTFRDQTSGRLTDLMGDEGLACAETQGVLSYLVGSLVSYKEEGVELTPTVLLCDSIAEVLQAIPGSISYEIGSVELSKEAGSRILKECGVLASGNWFIYIERSDGRFRFGVAAYPAAPLSVTLHEAIGIRSDGFGLMIRRTAQSAVEVIGGRGHELSLVFSTVREAPAESVRDAVERFAQSCCHHLSGEEGCDHFRRFFRELLLRVVESCHGTILVCFVDGRVNEVDQLQESVTLSPPIDFYSAFEEHRTAPSAESLIKLQNYESLLSGLLKADGVVAFSDAGQLIAYRAFFRPSASNAAVPVVGGARRRAFEGIAQCIGDPLTAVLFRSQDGLTIYRCAND